MGIERYIKIIALLLITNLVLAEPPEITVSPRDTIVSCEVADPIPILQEWYQNAAGAVAIDDMNSDVSIVGEIPFPEVLSIFNNSLGTLCGDSQEVGLRFVAMDEDGEQTFTDSVFFKYTDITRPEILMNASRPAIPCNEITRDSFNRWIQLHGHSLAQDECSDITWTTFIWNDSEGNSGTGDILNGPYPPLLDECTFFYRVSFIVEDECGNQSASPGRFTIIDSRGPALDSLPPDVTVLCDDIPDFPSLTASDYCDPDPSVKVSDFSNQPDNPEWCEHYNYTIERLFKASDACGNTTSHKQIITVVDTLAVRDNLADTIKVDCDGYLMDSLYVELEPLCNDFTLEITDEQISAQPCMTTIQRKYFVNDLCDNADTLLQTILVQDMEAPTFIKPLENRYLSCEKLDSVDQYFKQWLDMVLAMEVMDGCSSPSVFAATPGSYDIDDVTTYPGSAPTFTAASMCNSDEEYAALQVDVDFVLYDECQNASVVTGLFIIEDKEAPSVTSCPSDTTVTIENGECSTDVTLPTIEIMDACGDQISNEYEYTFEVWVDGLLTGEFTEGEEVKLQNIAHGQHNIVYIAKDCAENKTNCNFTLSVNDTQAPEIIRCPQDTTLEVVSDCTRSYDMSTEIFVSDNCGLGNIYQYMQPIDEEDAYLNYEDQDTVVVLKESNYVFENVANVFFTEAAAQISFDIKAHADLKFVLYDENDLPIGDGVTTADCELQRFTYEVPPEVLNLWLEDNRISVRFQPTNNPPACGVVENGNDGISMATISITYSDAEIHYVVEGATTIEEKPLIGDELNSEMLNVGINEVTYIVIDEADNRDSCEYLVIIEENELPFASCKDIIVYTMPSTEINYILNPSEIDGGSTDNCGIDTMYVSNSMFNCSDYDQQRSITLYVRDFGGNVDSCSATVTVEPPTLNPSYISGGCLSDTLRLFANLDEDGDYEYSWSGPAGFFSDEANPIIFNANTDNNGSYTLTISGTSGCMASGIVEVNVESLATPSILANEAFICSGSELTLSTSSYGDGVTYSWYEGVAPEGMLIASTDDASYILEPSFGEHQYYVVASGNNCTSNPSESISVEVVQSPSIEVVNSTISICEGDDLALQLSSTNDEYNYMWFGPNGYQSDSANPDTIMETTMDQAGIYKVVASQGSCISDTTYISVEINTHPEQPIINGELSYCLGEEVVLSVMNVMADNYEWILNGEVYTSETSSILNIPSANTDIAGTWSVIAYQGECGSESSETITIEIASLENIVASNSGPVCEGESVVVNVSTVAGATYSWTGPDGFISDDDSFEIAAVPGTYTVIVTSPDGCQGSSTTEVIVGQVPLIADLSSDAEDCMMQSDTIRFNYNISPADGDFTYSWSGPDGFTATTASPIVTNLDAGKSGEYELVVSNEGCASETLSVDVEFKITPDQPSILTDNLSICEGETVILQSSVSGESYTWSTPRGFTTTTTAELTLEDLTDGDDGYYIVRAINGDCSSMPSDSLYIEVGSVPMMPEFTTNAPICQGDTLRISIDVNDDLAIEWLSDGTILSTEAQLTIPNVTQDIVDNIRLRLSDGSCSASPFELEGVTVDEELMVPVLEQSAYNFCAGNNINLDLCIDPDTYLNNVVYTVEDNQGATVGTFEENCITIEGLDAEEGNYAFTVVGNRGNCRSTSESINIAVSAAPDIMASILSGDQEICRDGSLTFFSEYGPPDVELKWSSDNESITFTDDGARITTGEGLMLGKNVVYLTYSLDECRDYSIDSVIITRVAEPLAMDDAADVNAGEEVTIDILSNDEIPDNYTITLTDVGTMGTVMLDGYQLIYKADDDADGEDIIKYEICVESCDTCSEAIVSINIQGAPKVECIYPTIITPNDDGTNDAFVIPCIENGIDIELTVFNEWGSQVFHADRYRNDWEGTYNNDPLPVGTYYYVIKNLTDDSISNGFLIIQR